MKRLRRALALTALALWLMLPAAALAPDAPAGTLGVQLTSLGACVPGAQECDLGDLAADAARACAGADAALLPACLLQNDLPAGALTGADVARALRDAPLVTASLSPAQLCALLETALAPLVIDAELDRYLPEASAHDGFLQISGLKVTVDLTAPAGGRVYQLAREDGTRLDRADGASRLLVVTTADVCPDGADADLALHDALVRYLSAQELTALSTGRYRMIGTADAALVHQFPRGAILTALAVIAALCIFFRGKERASRPFRPIREGEYSDQRKV